MIIYLIIFDILLFCLIIIPSFLINFNSITLNLLLILYRIVLILKLNFINNRFWYSYILYLIIIGGIIILFLYLTRISNNELILFKFIYYIYIILKLILIICFYYIYLYLNYNLNINLYLINIDCNNFIYLNIGEIYRFKNLYINISIDINIYIIIYLFLVIIICVLVCIKNRSPLRQMFKI